MSPATVPIRGPETWLGRDMTATTDWIRPLPAVAIDEMDVALQAVKRGGLAWLKFGREDFPLPTFSRELTAVGDELEHGRGFVLLRGFPVDRYSVEDRKNLYWGDRGTPRRGALPERRRRADRRGARRESALW